MPRKKPIDDFLSVEETKDQTPPPKETSIDASKTPLPEEEKDIDQQIEDIFEKGVKAEEPPEEKELPTKKKETKEEETEEEKVEEKITEEKKLKEEKPKVEKEVEKEEKPPIETTPDKSILEKYGLNKFKSLDDALEAYKNLESAYGRAMSTISNYERGIVPEEVKEGVQGALAIASRPRVSLNLPDPQGYVLEDGNFDISGYLRDVLTDYTIQLQKSIILGPLASAIYTIQKTAVEDKYNTLKSEMEMDKQAVEVYNEIVGLYPQLKSDEKLVAKLERAIAGEAIIKGKPLTKDEIIGIAKELLSSTPSEEPSPPTVEPLKGTGSIEETPTTSSKDKYEETVDEILESSLRKKQSIF